MEKVHTEQIVSRAMNCHTAQSYFSEFAYWNHKAMAPQESHSWVGGLWSSEGWDACGLCGTPFISPFCHRVTSLADSIAWKTGRRQQRGHTLTALAPQGLTHTCSSHSVLCRGVLFESLAVSVSTTFSIPRNCSYNCSCTFLF